MAGRVGPDRTGGSQEGGLARLAAPPPRPTGEAAAEGPCGGGNACCAAGASSFPKAEDHSDLITVSLSLSLSLSLPHVSDHASAGQTRARCAPSESPLPVADKVLSPFCGRSPDSDPARDPTRDSESASHGDGGDRIGPTRISDGTISVTVCPGFPHGGQPARTRRQLCDAHHWLRPEAGPANGQPPGITAASALWETRIARELTRDSYGATVFSPSQKS